MKSLIITVAQVCVTTASVFAQHDHSDHQKQSPTTKTDTSKSTTVTGGVTQKQFSQLLAAYYNLKNALVSNSKSWI